MKKIQNLELEIKKIEEKGFKTNRIDPIDEINQKSMIHYFSIGSK